MGFKLKSGNRTNFKSMGSSPAKDMKTGSYSQSFESPAKHVDSVNEGSNRNKRHADKHNKKHSEGGTHGKIGSKDNKWDTPAPDSPAKQKLNKGGEGQDQNKIFDEKGNHIGDYVNDKKVMHKIPNDDNRHRSKEDRAKLIKNMEKKDLKTLKKSPAKQVKTSGLGPRSSFGGVKNPELTKDKKKPFSTYKFNFQSIPENTPKVMRDGLKNAAHGVKDPGNWQPHQFKKKKSPAKDKPVLTHDHNYGKESGEKQSPAKQTKDTFKDGSKKSSRDKFNDTETAIEQRKADRKDDQRRFTNKGVKTIVGEKSSGLGPRAKNSGMTRTQAARNKAEMSGLDSKSPYWFKINGKTVNKKQYLNYENKPGNMEGGGKQTNHPDVYGRKANNHGRGPKTK